MSQQSPSSPPDSAEPQFDATRVTADEQLFQVPPLSERRSFVDSDPWRVLRILGEFVAGFEELADVRRAVTFFGSARTEPSDSMYKLAVDTARLLGQNGFVSQFWIYHSADSADGADGILARGTREWTRKSSIRRLRR